MTDPRGQPPRPAAIIVNERAGSASTPRVRRAVELARRALDADVLTTATRDPDELAAWLSGHVERYRTLVVAGGDGSLAVACNGVAGRDTVLGYIPAGTGNATASLLRLPRSPEALVAVLARAETRPVDLLAVNGRLALFAGVGWDAIVAGRYAQAGAHGLPGWAWAIARSLPDLARAPSVQVEADGTLVHDGPMELLVVGTTPWWGRGLLVNPGARPDAGRLTARIYPPSPARFAVDALRWAAHRRPSVEPVRATRIRVRSSSGDALPLETDGDVLGARPEWHVEVRPAAVRLIGRWEEGGAAQETLGRGLDRA
ncbi:MAG TPA: diacylglycerol kinase family protein [candidate division Zixibacteria bacterium]|nr:diacylglycerol kinase family protein [candidate division Zixibacteria bacterium]